MTTVSIAGYHLSEQLYNGSRILVYRGIRQADLLPVVIKLLKNSCPSFTELVQFRNQYTITKNLNSPLIVQTYSLETYQNGYMLVMEDFGGISLDNFAQLKTAQTICLQEFLEIAIALCDALDILYKEGIIHKDIKPSNILINPETKEVKLIDFSIASLLPRETQTLTNPNVLEGTLSYISPEQTGRMNRGIDYRTDFYSLGVTFYELLTGKLPFRSKNAMELIHCHIAKKPPLVHEINSQVPSVISKLVSKLMEKNAEDRYQSALSLKFDLNNCLVQLKETGKIKSFEIAQNDVCDRLIISDKLYGREAEIENLLQASERVSLGATEMMLVAGFSGIGKTAVVNEVYKPILRQQGYFIKGKYDQFNRNIPFSGFVQAFRDLIKQLLTENDARIYAWKTKILDAVGENGQLIIEIVPELEIIIGKQPSVIELPGTAAQNRFHLLLQKFTQVFTSKEHPLVIFLDDLQWADSASLNLMQLLMAHTTHLFLIGAYRDNEVTPTHPLMLSLNEIAKTKAIINTIALSPLNQTQINKLVADTLNFSEELAWDLSQLISQKTQGNPFFATQCLKALYQDKLIQFNFEIGCWECDVTQITQQSATDDVVDFMAFQLRRLPSSTQEVLQLAACIGNQFDLATLAIISKQSQTETAACLWKALQEGLILPTGDIYKFYIGQESQLVNQEISQNVTYKFLHDRIQQAAYSLIPEEHKQLTHLSIGQLLLANTHQTRQDEQIFEIVNQLNHGISSIDLLPQHQQYAQLNLRAARKAKESTAYITALHYLNYGMEWLTTNGWDIDADLMHRLHEEAAEVALLNCDFEQMESLSQKVLQRTNSLLQQVKIYEIKLQAYQVQNRQLQAITTGREILEKLGVTLPESVTPLESQQQVESTLASLSDQAIANLANLPKMQDLNAVAALRIMIRLVPSIHQAAPQLFPSIACQQVNLSLKYGNSPFSAPGYADFGIVVGTVLNQLETAYQFGQLALHIMDEFSEKSVQSMVQFKVAAFNQSNRQNIRQAIDLLKKSYQVALETGDSVHALVSTSFRLFYTYLSGTDDLENLSKEVEIYQSKFLTSQHFLSWAHIISWSIKNFTLAENSSCLGSDLNDEKHHLSILIQENDELALHLFFLSKLILSYSFGDISLAIQDADQGAKYIKAGIGMPSAPVYYYYDSLTRLSLYTQVDFLQQEKLLSQVEENQKKLSIYAEAAPMNYQHKYYLVEAVRYQILDNKLATIEYYDLTIKLAHENGFIQDEALGNELACKFYLNWGKEKVAAGYIQEAYYCYLKWGAKAKINNLEKSYPQLLKAILEQPRINLNPWETISSFVFGQTPTSTDRLSTSSSSISGILDFASILKAAQTISGSIELDELVTNLTKIILENSGAKKSIVILPQNNNWEVKAITLLDNESNSQELVKTILSSQSIDTCQEIPQQIINYVKNTQQILVIDNCQTDISGLMGEYMLQHQPKSVLCIPIMNQGHLVGIIYLENKITSGVFTQERQQIISLLSSQIAISLENAQLYSNLQSSEARFLHLAENAPGMIYQFQLSPDGIPKFNYVSSGCYEIYEILPEQAVRDANKLILLTHPEDIAYFQESVAISAQTLQPWQYQGRITTPSGQLKWIQAVSRPIKQSDGTIIWDGLLLDITERKQAEAAIQEKSQELENALQDLQQAQLQIIQSEKMSALGNLVAGIAHEMNNPLGFISATLKQAKPTIADVVEHLKLYQENLPNPNVEIIQHAEEIDLDYSLEDLPKMINTMLTACERLKNISTSLRTFSRADQDYKVPFNIHEGIDSTILILKHRLKANEQRPAIEVTTVYGDLPQIQCFPGQLNQVFMNILANAVDALDEVNIGRRFEEIKENPNRITIKTFVENNYVKISIDDNGKGMSESVIQKIFDHLFTTKAVGKGTGLGLAIARQIIETNHGGNLICNSVLGNGTEFLIEIPL
ncbi:ATP-binding sensor histidine kinase [Calothrix sp. PCC 6303]|uniref:ATP-binding sensor histidine kinase n=1 Tax=Calothrix sp. PCC 6303 TaxID=1170562 RepID=UPI0002A02386|nr:ATP-binding sensor histidine kinase [Calothrix sp. PCC 6303]AFZ03477.1 multi-sensor signal transduction multi-kinase [Calothrix sp. PCC 6303]